MDDDALRARYAKSPGTFEKLIRARHPEVLARVEARPGASFKEQVFQLLWPERCTRLKCACGQPLAFKGHQRGYGTSCSTTCKAAWAERHERIKRTVHERYGVDSVLQVPEVRARIERTNLERYGSVCSAQGATVTAARLRTLLGNQAVVAKRTRTLEARYGVSQSTQLEVVQRAARAAQQAQHEARWTAAVQRLGALDLTLVDGAPGQPLTVRHACGHEYGIGTLLTERRLASGKVPMCQACYPGVSRPEQLLVKALREAGLTVLVRNRDLIKPYELDLVLPDHALAIEVNGVYWHRRASGTLPLLQKTELTRAAGYRLLHLWDHEVLTRLDTVVRMVLARCGRAPRTSARRCEVRHLDASTAATFLAQHHLQGTVPSSVKLGLYHEEALVAVATFSKPRFARRDKTGWELVRFATDGRVVAGGLSRLCAAFRRQHPGPLVSYADLRFADGRGYEAAGWTLTRRTVPGYLWVQPATGQALKRYQTQKAKLPALLGDRFDPALSEERNMQRAGFHQLKDCGHLVFTMP